ncbi:hypothetical protein [Rhodoferax sp. OV413]|uniref:hypothetical protein n=1 Tax=Rhodoferax sp. OV413 TaxID=1855285 RepID=UPI00115FC158|nr:hypothetical protein [Rhodoferax sp. OV413]
MGVVAVALLIGGCGQSNERPVVTIQQVEPASGAGLVSGEHITFTVKARVQGVLGKNASVGLVVQSDAEMVAYAPPVPVENGRDITLTVTAVIPKAASIRLFTPMYIGGAERTDVLDTRVIKIIANQAP